MSATVAVAAGRGAPELHRLLYAAGLDPIDQPDDAAVVVVPADNTDAVAAWAARCTPAQTLLACTLDTAIPIEAWLTAGAAEVTAPDHGDALTACVTRWRSAHMHAAAAPADPVCHAAWVRLDSDPEAVAALRAYLEAETVWWVDFRAPAAATVADAQGVHPPLALSHNTPEWVSIALHARRPALWAIADDNACTLVLPRRHAYANGVVCLRYTARVDLVPLLACALRTTNIAVAAATEPLPLATAAFDLVGDGVTVVHRNGRIEVANRALAVLLGYTQKQLAGRMLTDLAPPEQREACRTLVANRPSGRPAPRELALLDRTGARRRFSVSAMNADADRVVLDLHDTTETHTLNRELLRAKRLFEDIVTSSPNAIVVADRNGVVQLLNPVAQRLTGWRLEDARRAELRFADLLTDTDGAALLERVRNANDESGPGRLTNVRAKVRTRQNQRVPILLNAVALSDDTEAEGGTMAILTDIRQLVTMEQELNEARRQVIQSEREAALVALAGATAHHLNQPLTAVLGYVQMLKRQHPDFSADPAVQKIETAAEQMAAIVREIGRITHFETTDYGHRTRILELSDREGKK